MQEGFVYTQIRAVGNISSSAQRRQDNAEGAVCGTVVSWQCWEDLVQANGIITECYSTNMLIVILRVCRELLRIASKAYGKNHPV